MSEEVPQQCLGNARMELTTNHTAEDFPNGSIDLNWVTVCDQVMYESDG